MQCKVLNSFHNRLETKLNDLVEKGVVVSVDGPTDWINSLVVVKKDDGDLRVCLDARDLNRAIKTKHYHWQTLQSDFMVRNYSQS